MVRRACGRAVPAVLVLGTTLLATACGGAVVHPGRDATSPGTGDPSGVAMAHPGELQTPLYTQDLLVVSRETIPADVRTRIAKARGVEAAEPFSLGSFYAEERAFTFAAVDPGRFRRFTPAATAQMTSVWERVADGELGLRPEVRDLLPVTADDWVSLGNGADAPRVHIAALAPLSPSFHAQVLDAVVNSRWAARLGLPADNAVLVSTGSTSPQDVRARLLKIVGEGISVQVLGPNLDVGSVQTAVLTGGSVASAVGSFTYTINSDGTVNPSEKWIRDYIRTEQVPILGSVRCNKAMLPQLRAALREIVDRGLADKIHPREYGGCYVPRFISRDPSRGLSFHTWGTAIDVNVPGNQRGTVGLIDRTVVAIFEKWGFNWGGRWRYTDPMHFELARIVKVR